MSLDLLAMRISNVRSPTSIKTLLTGQQHELAQRANQILLLCRQQHELAQRTDCPPPPPPRGKLTCGAGTHVPALFALLLFRPASAAVPPIQWHTSTTTRASWLPSSTRRSECQCPSSSTRSEWQLYTSSTRRSASHQCPSSTRRSDNQFSFSTRTSERPSSTRRSECDHRRPSSTRRSGWQCPGASDAPRKR